MVLRIFGKGMSKSLITIIAICSLYATITHLIPTARFNRLFETVFILSLSIFTAHKLTLRSTSKTNLKTSEFKLNSEISLAKTSEKYKCLEPEHDHSFDNTVILSEAEIKQFIKGIPAVILENQRTGPENIPYDKQLEICYPQLTITSPKSEHEGFYGVNYKGILRGLNRKEKVEVLIKKNKSLIETHNFKRFLLELKTILFVGQHENILKVVGAWTKEISEGHLIIVTEFCAHSLYQYLCQIRGQSGISAYDYTAIKKIQQSTVVDNEIETLIHVMNRWVYEIASGMLFLSNKGVIHGALGTRNIMLTGDKTVRLTEFGIAPYLDETEKPNSINLTPVAEAINDSWLWRNLPCESLNYGIFTAMSDVWSYGITSWEIFSFGTIPYTEFDNCSEAFILKLKSGLRPHHDKTLFTCKHDELIERCWSLEPTDRPDFKDILLFMYDLTCPKRRSISFQ